MAALPDYPDAFQSIRTGPWRTSPIETVGLAEAPGRVLAEPLLADRDLPPFDRSAMDGYAVRSKDLEEADSLPSAGFIAAGDSDPPEVPSGYCVGIATGAPVPPQLDAVAPHEWTDRGDPVSFERKPETGNAIHHRGSDASGGRRTRIQPVPEWVPSRSAWRPRLERGRSRCIADQQSCFSHPEMKSSPSM